MFFINYFRTLRRDRELVARLCESLLADGEDNDWTATCDVYYRRDDLARYRFRSAKLGLEFQFDDDSDLHVKQPCPVVVHRARAAPLLRLMLATLRDDSFEGDDDPVGRRRKLAFLARLAKGEFPFHTTVEATVDMLGLRRALRPLKGETFVIRRRDDNNSNRVLYHVYFTDATEGVMFKLGN